MRHDYEKLDSMAAEAKAKRNYRIQSFQCCSSCRHHGGDGETAEYCDKLIEEGIPEEAWCSRFTDNLGICDAYESTPSPHKGDLR